MIAQSGKYDRLYKESSILWGTAPGRMVRIASRQLAPDRAIDVGAGDGKNIVFLERNGWTVDGIDESRQAHAAFEHRCSLENHTHRGKYEIEDALSWAARTHERRYLLGVLYGVAHCIEKDPHLAEIIGCFSRVLKNGGLLAFATFNSDLPIPKNHCTPDLVLRSHDSIMRFFESWEVVTVERGEITESHIPLVGEHKHALTWALLRTTQ